MTPVRRARCSCVVGRSARGMSCAAMLLALGCGPQWLIYESDSHGAASGSTDGPAGTTGAGSTGGAPPAADSTSSGDSDGTTDPVRETSTGSGTTGGRGTTGPRGTTGGEGASSGSTSDAVVSGGTSSTGSGSGSSGEASTTGANGPEPIDWAHGCFEDTPNFVPEVSWLAVMTGAPLEVWSRPEGVYVRLGGEIVRFDPDTAAPDFSFANEAVLDTAVDRASFALTPEGLLMVGGVLGGQYRLSRWALPSGVATGSVALPGLVGVTAPPFAAANKGMYVHDGLLYVFFPNVATAPAETVRVFDIETLALVETITTPLLPEFERPVDVRVLGDELALISHHSVGHGRQLMVNLGSGVPFHDSTTSFQIWPERFLDQDQWPPIWSAHYLDYPYLLSATAMPILVPNDFVDAVDVYPERIAGHGDVIYQSGFVLGGSSDRKVGKHRFPSLEAEIAFGDAGALLIDPTEGALRSVFPQQDALLMSRWHSGDEATGCHTLEPRSHETGAPL